MKTSANESVTNQIPSIRKILVAVDLSEHSEATAFYAAEIAKCFDARLMIVHVYEPVPMSEYTCETTFTVLEEEREDLQKLLNQLTRKIQASGLICTSAFVVGAPAERISALARDTDADLIVTASHHPTFLGRLFHLDKATLILHRAPCPVLIYCNESTLVGDPKNGNFGDVRSALTASCFGESAFDIQESADH
jgi:nucleotide-binding universal stress UspA family protein